MIDRKDIDKLVATGVIVTKLLWENPTPSAEFNAQTISLDLSEYDQVEIKFNSRTGVNGSIFYKADIPGVISAWGMYTAVGETAKHFEQRTATVSTTGVAFAKGYICATAASTAWTENKLSLIPYKIFGIKNVQPI